MLLIIVRHGEAVPKSSGIADEDRNLTAAGKLRLKDNLFLAKEITGSKLDLILSSPLRRAKESAEVVGQVFDHSTFELDSTLVSESSPYELFRSLTNYHPLDKVLLVSHQPLVSQLIASLLNWDDGHFVFSPGSIAIIELKELALSAGGVLLSLIPGHRRA